MNPLVLVARESGNVLRSFWRNRSGAFFTILLPVMFLVFFGAINRAGTVQLSPNGPQISYTTFFAPGMLGMAIMAGAFVGLVIGLTVMRDNGQLKRLRGTPLPPWAFFCGQVVSRLVLIAVETMLVLGLGRLLFHVSLPPSATAWAAFALVVLLGAATFTAVGVAFTRLVANADSAPALANAAYLPLLFLSGAWFPVSGLPHWLASLTDAFPLAPMLDGMRQALILGHGPGAIWPDARKLLAWLAVGLLVALRTFRWERATSSNGAA
jgi:ABC-2 type transport system permease protein